jgi:ATP-dependent RNA helicase RhlE
MPPDLGALARMHLKQPARVSVGPQAVPPPKAAQDVYLVGNEEKTKLLLSMVATNPGNVLVFARTKHRTDRVMRSLCDAGFAAQRLHSNRTQQQRREALEGFRRGRYRILVATDIAARGIDVADIRHVINYDLPQTVEDYVHRVGRTARAEADGRATSFASPEERGRLRAIERHIGRPLPRQSAPASAARGPAAVPSHHRAPRPVEAATRERQRAVRPAATETRSPRHSRPGFHPKRRSFVR